MMAKKQNEPDRLSALLASVNEDMLGDGLPRHLTDNSIKVERILLEFVCPDPIQPRRVLPEQIHHRFHGNRLTPTQSLRELVQIAQVGARQHSRPFSNVLELLPDTESDTEQLDNLSPEEETLRDLVNLAVTIRDDRQVNPLTVVDMTEGVTRLYRIETGERRYWTTWILRDFISSYEHDGMIDCIVVPSEKSSVFRQAKENTARKGLSAIAMTRQAALLLLTVHGYEIPVHAVDNDFYRQALELDLRGKREYTKAILNAMGGIGKMRLSQYKRLLSLSDEALELADRYSLDERILRPILNLPSESHTEMIQQCIQLGLTARQVTAIVEELNAVLSYALNAHECGCSIIPLKGGRNRVTGKQPRTVWQMYQKQHVSVAQIEDWFREGMSAYEIVCGQVSRLIVIDFDEPDAQAKFIQQLPHLMDTYTVKSGGRGTLHLYFEVDFPVRTTKIRGGDLKAEGSYVVGAGSQIAGRKWEVFRDVPLKPISRQELDNVMSVFGIIRPSLTLQTVVKEIPGNVSPDYFKSLYYAFVQQFNSRNEALMMRDEGYDIDSVNAII